MSSKGHTTGMAGEFCVMERLFRLGHEASLTLGNAKTVDILTKSPTGKIYQVSVKAIRGGGKWGLGKHNFSQEKDLIFALLLYKDFDDPASSPEAWIVPGKDAEKLKKPWLGETFAIYYGNKEDRERLIPYKEAWAQYFE